MMQFTCSSPHCTMTPDFGVSYTPDQFLAVCDVHLAILTRSFPTMKDRVFSLVDKAPDFYEWEPITVMREVAGHEGCTVKVVIGAQRK